MDDPRTEFFTSGGAADPGENAFEARKLAFAQTVLDYEQVMEAVPRIPIPIHVADYIRTSAVGPAIGYFLAKNFEMYRRITWMPRAQATRELKKLESKLRKPLLFLVRGADEARVTNRLPAREFSWADDAELGQRVKAFAETVPDYDLVVHNCRWQVPGHMESYLRVSPKAPQVAYYLGQHKEIYDVIAATPPLGAVAKLLSLERELMELCCRTTPEALYSIPLPASPTSEECAAAQRLLHLATLPHSEVGTVH